MYLGLDQVEGNAKWQMVAAICRKQNDKECDLGDSYTVEMVAPGPPSKAHEDMFELGDYVRFDEQGDVSKILSKSEVEALRNQEPDALAGVEEHEDDNHYQATVLVYSGSSPSENTGVA